MSSYTDRKPTWLDQLNTSMLGVLNVINKGESTSRSRTLMGMIFSISQLSSYAVTLNGSWNDSQTGWFAQILEFTRLDFYLRASIEVATVACLITFAFVFMLLGITAFVGKMFSDGRFSSFKILNFLRGIADVSLSVLYIPIISTISAQLRCAYDTENDVILCNNATNSWLPAVAVLVGIPFLLFGVIATATLADISPFSAGVLRRTHTRVDIALVLYTAIVVTVFNLIDLVGINMILFQILLLAGGMLLTASYAYFLPYYDIHFLGLRTMTLAGFSWTSFCLVIVYQLNDTSSSTGALLLFLGLPVTAFIGYILPSIRLAYLMSKDPKTITSPYILQVYGNTMIHSAKSGLLRDRFRKWDISAESLESDKLDHENDERSEQIYLIVVKEVGIMYEEFAKEHHGSHILLILLDFYFYYHNDHKRMSNLVNQLSQYSLSLDENFVKYTRSNQIGKGSGNDDGDEGTDMVVNQLALIQNVSDATDADSMASMALFYFWKEATKPEPNISSLHMFCNTCVNSINNSYGFYEAALKLASENHPVRGQFASFLADVANELDYAKAITSKLARKGARKGDQDILDGMNQEDSHDDIIISKFVFAGEGSVILCRQSDNFSATLLECTADELEGLPLESILPTPLAESHGGFYQGFLASNSKHQPHPTRTVSLLAKTLKGNLFPASMEFGKMRTTEAGVYLPVTMTRSMGKSDDMFCIVDSKTLRIGQGSRLFRDAFPGSAYAEGWGNTYITEHIKKFPLLLTSLRSPAGCKVDVLIGEDHEFECFAKVVEKILHHQDSLTTYYEVYIFIDAQDRKTVDSICARNRQNNLVVEDILVNLPKQDEEFHIVVQGEEQNDNINGNLTVGQHHKHAHGSHGSMYGFVGTPNESDVRDLFITQGPGQQREIPPHLLRSDSKAASSSIGFTQRQSMDFGSLAADSKMSVNSAVSSKERLSPYEGSEFVFDYDKEGNLMAKIKGKTQDDMDESNFISWQLKKSKDEDKKLGQHLDTARFRRHTDDPMKGSSVSINKGQQGGLLSTLKDNHSDYGVNKSNEKLLTPSKEKSRSKLKLFQRRGSQTVDVDDAKNTHLKVEPENQPTKGRRKSLTIVPASEKLGFNLHPDDGNDKRKSGSSHHQDTKGRRRSLSITPASEKNGFSLAPSDGKAKHNSMSKSGSSHHKDMKGQGRSLSITPASERLGFNLLGSEGKEKKDRHGSRTISSHRSSSSFSREHDRFIFSPSTDEDKHFGNQPVKSGSQRNIMKGNMKLSLTSADSRPSSPLSNTPGSDEGMRFRMVKSTSHQRLGKDNMGLALTEKDTQPITSLRFSPDGDDTGLEFDKSSDLTPNDAQKSSDDIIRHQQDASDDSYDDSNDAKSSVSGPSQASTKQSLVIKTQLHSQVSDNLYLKLKRYVLSILILPCILLLFEGIMFVAFSKNYQAMVIELSSDRTREALTRGSFNVLSLVVMNEFKEDLNSSTTLEDRANRAKLELYEDALYLEEQTHRLQNTLYKKFNYDIATFTLTNGKETTKELRVEDAIFHAINSFRYVANSTQERHNMSDVHVYYSVLNPPYELFDTMELIQDGFRGDCDSILSSQTLSSVVILIASVGVAILICLIGMLPTVKKIEKFKFEIFEEFSAIPKYISEGIRDLYQKRLDVIQRAFGIDLRTLSMSEGIFGHDGMALEIQILLLAVPIIMVAVGTACLTFFFAWNTKSYLISLGSINSLHYSSRASYMYRSAFFVQKFLRMDEYIVENNATYNLEQLLNINNNLVYGATDQSTNNFMPAILSAPHNTLIFQDGCDGVSSDATWINSCLEHHAKVLQGGLQAGFLKFIDSSKRFINMNRGVSIYDRASMYRGNDWTVYQELFQEYLSKSSTKSVTLYQSEVQGYIDEVIFRKGIIFLVYLILVALFGYLVLVPKLRQLSVDLRNSQRMATLIPELY